MPEWVAAFGNWIIGFINAFGTISTAIVLLTAATTVYLWFSGFVPVLIRLGNGLRKRKIAIFANADAFHSLEALFADSRLFKSRNLIHIPSGNDLGRAEDVGVFLVYWPDWEGDLDSILSRKKDQTSLIIYAPMGRSRVNDDDIAKIERHRNVVIANLRGRLLNDIVTSLITTGYEKTKN